MVIVSSLETEPSLFCLDDSGRSFFSEIKAFSDCQGSEEKVGSILGE